MKKMIVLYDDWCPNCSRFIRTVKKLDWLKLIKPVRLRNPYTEQDKSIDTKKATEQMASYTTKWEYGFISIYKIFIRLPLFWFLFPFLLILKISGLGQLIYSEIAVKRTIIPLHCNNNICER